MPELAHLVLKPRRASPRVVIKPRDVPLLELVATFHLATLPDLLPHLTDHFPSEHVLWRRARLLTRGHYLAKPPEQHLRLFRKRGNPAHVFALGDAGATLLREHGRDLPMTDFDQKAKAWRSHTLDHALAATRVLSTLLLGVRALPTLERLAVFADHDFTDTTLFYERGGSVPLPIQPDATLSIRETTTGERLALFVEIDRGSEPLTRRALTQSSFLKKVLAYLSYFHEPERFEPILHASTFSVLTIADTPARASALRDVVRRADPDGHAANVFWFTTADNFSLDDPTHPLTSPIWTTAVGTEGALF